MNQKGFINIVWVLIVVVLIGAGAYFASTRQTAPPKENPEGEVLALKEGQRESSFLLQKIYPDHVEGLNYWEYPVARDEGYPVTLLIGEIVSNGCTVQLTLLSINGDTATFSK